jgi:DeoR/GlpR family transcriptional regulator of sugar metabolism
MKKREVDILKIVAELEKVEVSKLAEMMNVSQVTIRKALDELEEKGLILRERGYAIVNSKDDMNSRLAVNYEVKQRIAKAAAALIECGETILIESGSSCALLAELLAESKQNVTIITNSAFIAERIRHNRYAKVLLLGGEYQNESQVMVGPLVSKCVEGIYVNKLFIGTDGFSEEAGFTGKDLSRAEAVQNMSNKAANVIILTDSTKFDHHGVVSLLPFEKINQVNTDDGIKPEREKYLEKQGIDVTVV